MYKSYLSQSNGWNAGIQQDRSISDFIDGEYVFAVLDGHGTKIGTDIQTTDVVDFVSGNLVDVLWQKREQGKTIKSAFIDTFLQLQYLIKQQYLQGATTATVLYIDSEDNHYIAYVGDSPIYGWKDLVLQDILGKENYHKVGNIYMNVENVRLEKLYGREIIKRGYNTGYIANFNITRFLGNTRLVGENHIPEVMTLENKSDKYLLTSDGLDTFGTDGLEKIISGLDLETGVDKIMIEYEKKIKKALEFVKEQGIDFSNVNKHIDHATELGVERV